MDDSAENSPLNQFIQWMLPALDGVAEKADLSYVICCGSEDGPKSIYGKGFLVEWQRSFSEELAKKDEELLQKTQAINQLRNIGRKYKNQGTEYNIELKKVVGQHWAKLSILSQFTQSTSSIIQVTDDLEKRGADLAAEIAKVQSLSKEMSKKDEELASQERKYQELVKVLIEAQQAVERAAAVGLSKASDPSSAAPIKKEENWGIVFIGHQFQRPPVF